jgi:hypothetical protein
MAAFGFWINGRDTHLHRAVVVRENGQFVVMTYFSEGLLDT